MPGSHQTPEPVHRLCQLRDGRRVVVRRLLTSDREELAAGYASLSPASRRSRFGLPPERLSARDLDELVDLDFDDRFALVATLVDEPGMPGAGVARYVRDADDPTVAEAAVTVLDRYQRLGIGRILLQELVGVARAHGIETLTATVRWDSRRFLDAVASAGAVVTPSEPGVAAVRFELPTASVAASPPPEEGRP